MVVILAQRFICQKIGEVCLLQMKWSYMSGLFFKQESEPTSLLQFLEYLYAPLLMRITIPTQVYAPAFCTSFPKFLDPKYKRETREKILTSSVFRTLFCLLI